MNPNTAIEELYEIAARVIWFEPPEKALQDHTRFLAYSFRYAIFPDMEKIRNHFTDDDLRAALASAPPGIVDPRSWSYWHAMLGTFPPPPMPVRQLNLI